MKNRLACLAAALLFLQSSAPQYRKALPGYRYEFPRDHFDHPEFQTEWWYYTGNLKSADGHRFGFELTFFRQAVSREPAKSGTWDVKDIYLTHLALSNLDAKQFYHAKRMNRSGPGIAGVSYTLQKIWNGNWQVEWRPEDQELTAIDERFQLHLRLRSEKPPVIHGENGVSQKGEGQGQASHYISLTRLTTSGVVDTSGKKFEVSGSSWMDHEFFTQQLAPEQVGWDWLSLQLADNTELMLFNIRRRDGSIDPHSSGTYVDPNGNTTHLRFEDFKLQPTRETWTSPGTRAKYPIHWKVVVPKLNVELDVTTPLESQELAGDSKIGPNYWEGAIFPAGRRGQLPVSGVGYLEMTGYDRAIQFGIEAKPLA